MFPATEAGFCDVFGNVWEWTEDHFNGLESFDTHFLYDDFSSPCFDGKHNVMLVSAGVHTRVGKVDGVGGRVRDAGWKCGWRVTSQRLLLLY